MQRSWYAIIIKKQGSRGVLFTFEEQECPMGGGDSVYLINGNNRLYLCDTHLGPKSMQPIKEYIRANDLEKKELVIFLSHSDWDHIWGACAFDNATIVAHELCRKRIIHRGKVELQRFFDFHNGDITLVLPDTTFDSRLNYMDDDVHFFYAPGHTVDSAVCYDGKDSVLYLGDLVEDPNPVIGYHDLEVYLETLDKLQRHPAETLITSHSGIVGRKTITANTAYIQMFFNKATIDQLGEEADHPVGKLYLLLLYEDAIEQTMGDNFDYESFQRELWGSMELDYLDSRSELLNQISYDDLKAALESFLVQY